MSELGLGCVKTPTFNLRVEIPSRFRKFENQKCLRPLLREDDRENNSAHSWLVHVFTQPGQKRKSRHVQLRLLEGNEGFVQIADLTRSEGYRIGDPLPRAAADLGGIRTLLVVPLRKSGTVLGTFGGGARDKGPELRGVL